MIEAVVGSLRAGRAYGRRIAQSGAWGMRFPAFLGTGFHVVLDGDGWVTTRDAPPEPVHPGDVVLIPHGAEHALSHTPATTGAVADFTRAGEPAARPADFEFFCGLYRLDRAPSHPLLARMPDAVVVPADGDAALGALAQFVDHDVSRSRPGEQVTRAAVVDLLVTHVLRKLSAHRPYDAWPDPSIVPALDALHQASQRPWTVAGLAAACHLSRTTFVRRFTAAVGEPPMTYLQRLRLAGGARLLRETDLPLDAIARDIGYSTGFAFAHAFRREYGLAPGRFRRELQTA
ncbi:AraC family transcriptional regulator [Actinoplanes philippinensis]|uniref:AraC-type DNA-binding protein n=1 Tax=Actinoplanes philippinensis TaxID=35752 RepID=A0A1I2N4S3_9ACTN|nr:AraC family transcriptional regulator [Actinoplanes philippinensis]GIE76316.1 AraC family transcriptional regulator [Actinoplanes philippinensis]SFF98428.1 AraC-type DNA-binding protein [Actinoplanes philippinensis]